MLPLSANPDFKDVENSKIVVTAKICERQLMFTEVMLLTKQLKWYSVLNHLNDCLMFL